MISFTCLPFVFHLSPTWLPLWVVLVACFPSLVFHWSFICFHLSPNLGPVGRMISFTCLPFVPETGLPVWGSYSFQMVASLGRMILPLSPGLHPTLGALGRMSLRLSSTCLSHLSATLGALGRMSLQFKLVSHTCLSHLSRTLGASGRMSLHFFSRERLSAGFFQ